MEEKSIINKNPLNSNIQYPLNQAINLDNYEANYGSDLKVHTKISAL